MSVLRSFIFEQFPAIDQYGDPIKDCINSLHVASAGLLGDGFLHISIEEEWNKDIKKAYKTEVNLTLQQAKIVLESIKKWVDFQESKINGI
jgi:hypothetical protein